MIETWRWFGPSDSISLQKIRQAGATGIVSSLHEIATGELWTKDAIIQRKKVIEDAGLSWDVIESIPVHNDIKTRTGNYLQYIENYKQSIINAAECGVYTICYNFMPVVDWTRTNLMYRLPNNSHALRFEMTDFAAYDIYMLDREGAEQSYSEAVLNKAKARFDKMSEAERTELERNIIAGLPGGEGSYTRDEIRTTIQQFIDLGTEGFRAHLFAFLREIIPVAESVGALMCIHPDDPPFSLFGLPRVVSTASDANALLEACPSPANGLTMCAGSYGARGDNNLVEMVKQFGPSIYFVHLRNVIREDDGSFYESDHLDGDNDMVGLVEALLSEEKRRKLASKGEAYQRIPMRPDHGHLLDDELNQEGVKPGYSYMGRLKGLAELRGVIHTVGTLVNR
ncbi:MULTISPECIES: mannonate dehydratase [Alteromonadaceae]|jgi:mannonate dehydratase|uniref:Mannonate dehydratase n=1 Tax=Brumicola blandensis TaxID=3075611 RepID=A0AAW8R1Y7_9ALTE|nr:MULTISPECIES: mannonate dehydratase [unclassified Alteromonas]MDT0582216.1 mannonate dehydratase [Alteromonas sp. W409]MDT0627828.1 mannonate dehydratase [Alteromonas sp. W364]